MLGIAGCSKQAAPGGESASGSSSASASTSTAAPVDLEDRQSRSRSTRTARRSSRRPASRPPIRPGRQGHLRAGEDRHMAGALTDPTRRWASTSRTASSWHWTAQRRQPWLPDRTAHLRHRGRSAEGHRDRTADSRRRLDHRAGRPRRSPVRPRPPEACSIRPPAATASGHQCPLSSGGWKTFLRGLANDGVQGPSVANYEEHAGRQEDLRRRRQHRLRHRPAKAVRDTLGPVADSACNISVKKGDKDFSAAVTQVKGARRIRCSASGYYAEAALVRAATATPASPASSPAPTAPRIPSSSSRPARP